MFSLTGVGVGKRGFALSADEILPENMRYKGTLVFTEEITIKVVYVDSYSNYN